MLVENLDVEADGLLAGEGVEIAANGVDLAGDPLGGAGSCPLEHHVLDEVGDAIQFGDFMARTSTHPHTHGDGSNMLHALGEDDEAAGEDAAADISFSVHFQWGVQGRLYGKF